MKTKWGVISAAVVWGHVCLMVSAAGQEVSEPVSHHDSATGLTVLRANVSLPVSGYWFADPEKNAGSSLGDVFITGTKPEQFLQGGRRMARRAEQQELQRDRWPLDRLAWSIRGFSSKHEGKQPASLDELGDQLDNETRKQLAANYQVLKDLAIDPQQLPGKARIVAFETKPLVGDGKHWVLLSNGMAERRAIDSKLASSHGVEIKARRALAAEPGGAELKLGEFVIHARVLKDTPAVVMLKNPVTDKTVEIRIDPAKAKPGDREVLASWAMSRMWSMPLSGDGMTSAVLPHWLHQAAELYGAKTEDFAMGRGFDGPNPRGNTTGIFNVLGGRAAIQETLQLQDIQARQDAAAAEQETPISQIQGVEVKSHPFEEMLGNKQGGRIPLAEMIPADRLFAYFPKPAGLISWLDGGAEFLFNTGASATGRSLEYGLSERYIAALGMDRDWMKRLLDSGAVEEIAVMMPDLFLIDGTEVTAVARLKNPLIAAGLLQLIGIKNLDTQVERKGAHGETSHWAKRGDLLIISTAKGELEKVLKLHAAGGKGSLGQSAELRYMLTKLPPRDATRAFVYLSDPFIRRLVGPETKIPQHRRIRARGELEALAAGSLLYRLDGHESGTMAELLAKHYVSKPLVATDAAPDLECGAVSGKFGPLPRMNSLLDLGITSASRWESDAYRQYLESYNRFWRRYFDPIALRLDQPDPGTYELSVFILPLIDNSIYNGLRGIIADGKDGGTLKVPVIEPEPVATLSMNLNEQTWIETGGEMLEGFMRQVGIDGAILDSLGPDIHVAIADADPILELGSGELTQAFGARMDNSEMIAIPAIVSMFTRPTAVCVGLGDPAAVRRALDSSVGRKSRLSGGEISGSLYKVADRDNWIYRISFFDTISLRLGIEVQDRFLVIRNMPLTTPFRITGVKEAELPGARVGLSPRACRLQLPVLFASAAERERSAAFNGITDLQPLLLTGVKSVGEAAERYKAWFGFRPRHPGGGEWSWDGRTMTSNRYGSPRQPMQPDYKADDRDFGPLRRVDAVEVGMRFEEDGLRTTARWNLRPVSK